MFTTTRWFVRSECCGTILRMIHFLSICGLLKIPLYDTTEQLIWHWGILVLVRIITPSIPCLWYYCQFMLIHWSVYIYKKHNFMYVCALLYYEKQVIAVLWHLFQWHWMIIQEMITFLSTWSQIHIYSYIMWMFTKFCSSVHSLWRWTGVMWFVQQTITIF